jgi:hypothetical protein
MDYISVTRKEAKEKVAELQVNEAPPTCADAGMVRPTTINEAMVIMVRGIATFLGILLVGSPQGTSWNCFMALHHLTQRAVMSWAHGGILRPVGLCFSRSKPRSNARNAKTKNVRVVKTSDRLFCHDGRIVLSRWQKIMSSTERLLNQDATHAGTKLDSSHGADDRPCLGAFIKCRVTSGTSGLSSCQCGLLRWNMRLQFHVPWYCERIPNLFLLLSPGSAEHSDIWSWIHAVTKAGSPSTGASTVLSLRGTREKLNQRRRGAVLEREMVRLRWTCPPGGLAA